MSQENKEAAEQAKKYFEKVQKDGEVVRKNTERFDKELSTKIQKVQEGAQEVVKHIEKKLGHEGS